MSKLYDLPLKVLWIWNCNEAEIAIEFYFKGDKKKYQVKGSGVDAFNYDGQFKVCSVDNIESTYLQKPSTTVFIEDADSHKKILNYWKFESGEQRYNEVLNQLKKYKKSLDIPLFKQSDETNEDAQGDIVLSSKQVMNLVFEMEALLDMQRVFRGEVSKSHIETLLKASTEGFSQDTIDKIREELDRKGLL